MTISLTKTSRFYHFFELEQPSNLLSCRLRTHQASKLGIQRTNIPFNGIQPDPDTIVLEIINKIIYDLICNNHGWILFFCPALVQSTFLLLRVRCSSSILIFKACLSPRLKHAVLCHMYHSFKPFIFYQSQCERERAVPMFRARMVRPAHLTLLVTALQKSSTCL